MTAAALLPALRIPALAVVAVAAGVALARSGQARPGGPDVAWIAVVPVAVALALGLLPDPRVADPGACDDLFAPPVVRRVGQAAAVLLVIAVLARRRGGRASLGAVMPADGRVAGLAAASALLVPVALVVGPLAAEPFFGEVRLGPPSFVALVPAAIFAVANAALEEGAYRGAIQRWGAPALGRGGAILAQALVFGSAHQGADIPAGGPLIWVGIVGAGVVAGLIAHRTGSLLLPFAVHAAVDVPLALALTCRLA